MTHGSRYAYDPNHTLEEKMKVIRLHGDKIGYSPRYSTDHYEYRHVIIPKQLCRYCPPGICEESIWRGLGIRQSPGWEMYMRHAPEPWVLLFRRPITSELPPKPAPLADAAARFLNLASQVPHKLPFHKQAKLVEASSSSASVHSGASMNPAR